MKDLVLKNPMSVSSSDEDHSMSFQETNLRRGFEECLMTSAAEVDLESGGAYEEEGSKETFWSRVKRAVGWQDGGPVRLRRAKVRFSLE